jgi:hypothetical protein
MSRWGHISILWRGHRGCGLPQLMESRTSSDLIKMDATGDTCGSGSVRAMAFRKEFKMTLIPRDGKGTSILRACYREVVTMSILLFAVLFILWSIFVCTMLQVEFPLLVVA